MLPAVLLPGHCCRCCGSRRCSCCCCRCFQCLRSGRCFWLLHQVPRYQILGSCPAKHQENQKQQQFTFSATVHVPGCFNRGTATKALDLARHGKQFEGKAAAHFACLIYMVDQPKHEQLGINAGAVHAGVTVICSWPEMQQMMHKHSNVRDQASDETCFWGVACMLGNKYSKRAKQTKKQHQCPPHAGQQCHALQIDQHTKYALHSAPVLQGCCCCW